MLGRIAFGVCGSLVGGFAWSQSVHCENTNSSGGQLSPAPKLDNGEGPRPLPPIASLFASSSPSKANQAAVDASMEERKKQYGESLMKVSDLGKNAEGGDAEPKVAEEDVDPVKMVIVGGGFAGGKMAALFDSVFAITLIDTKNYQEFIPDLVPILCSKWSDEIESSLTKYLILHRFYTKRANVVTSTVTGVTENKTVVLQDKREVPYDILVMATGQQRAFPYSTTQRTMNQRRDEIHHMNKFLTEKCNSIAIIGGGPLGVTTACNLAYNHPEKKITLYAASPVLLPMLPYQTQTSSKQVTDGFPNLTVRLNERVLDVERITPATVDASGKSVPSTVVTAASEQATVSFWRRLWPFRKEEPKWNGLDDQYRLSVGVLGDGKVKVNSVLHQIYFNSPPVETVPGKTIVDTKTEGPYDYVFVCTGGTPRNEVFKSSKILRPHIDYTNRFHISSLMQMLGHPTHFAVGAATGIPFMNSYGNHDLQVRCIFRNFYRVLATPDKAKRVQTFEGQGVPAHSMKVPRMLLLLHQDLAVGSTMWSGSIIGNAAVTELVQDRQQLLQNFVTPMFYRSHQTSKVRKNIDAWAKEEITEVADFYE
jgi:NADH dehydrogenase FAD-containing subunit